MRKLIAICAGLVLFTTAYASPGTWTTIGPGLILGIDGDNLVGYRGGPGFLYSRSNQTYTYLYAPGASSTYVRDIDGGSLVGYAYPGGGFLYNDGTWTSLHMPEGWATFPTRIDGDNIVGWYETSSQSYHGFLYDGTTWTTLDMMPSDDEDLYYYTRINGIDGSNLVGDYIAYGHWHGFLYDGTTWTTLDAPGASVTHIMGIDGSNIVGYYTDASGTHGFLYDGSTWTTLDMPVPGTIRTYINAIDGDTLVGSYYKAEQYYGFVYEIPEPATLLLLGLGALILRKRKI